MTRRPRSVSTPPRAAYEGSVAWLCKPEVGGVRDRRRRRHARQDGVVRDHADHPVARHGLGRAQSANHRTKHHVEQAGYAKQTTEFWLTHRRAADMDGRLAHGDLVADTVATGTHDPSDTASTAAW